MASRVPLRADGAGSDEKTDESRTREIVGQDVEKEFPTDGHWLEARQGPLALHTADQAQLQKATQRVPQDVEFSGPGWVLIQGFHRGGNLVPIDRS